MGSKNMNNQSKTRYFKMSHLAGLLTVKKLGGTLDDAIRQAKASMPKEDVEAVLAEFRESLINI